MRILVTGKGGAGSWAVRGEQLGQAIGATVRRDASTDDLASHDLVIVVKKWSDGLGRRIATCGKPILWDIVDGWPQGRGWSVDKARQYIEGRYFEVGATACVFATMAQAVDIRLPGFFLKHHANPALTRNAIRERVEVVGYEGSPRYLAPWAVAEIKARGWRFQMSLQGADIAIATRAHPYDDDPTRRWKSNVKLANCQATGTPCVLPRECGYLEQDDAGPMYYATRDEFRDALDYLACPFVRKRQAMQLAAGAPRLQDVAARYLRCVRKFFGPDSGGQQKRSGSSAA